MCIPMVVHFADTVDTADSSAAQLLGAACTRAVVARPAAAAAAYCNGMWRNSRRVPLPGG
jgi:hypothetical protein